MDTQHINLFIFDTRDNFEKSKSYLGSEGAAFKRIICVENTAEFDREFESLGQNELVFMAVHVFYTDQIKGIKKFVVSTIRKRYPLLQFMYISEGDGKEIQHKMIEANIDPVTIYKYHQVISMLEEGKLQARSKKEILSLPDTDPAPASSSTYQEMTESNQSQHYRYAIITALEEDEMAQILPMIEKEGVVSNTKHLIEYGYLKQNPQKKIVYASQQTTGMIDAAILATELLVRFKPKYLIMPGVLGGKPKVVNIGDIIVSTKVFTIDKGKLTDKQIMKDETVQQQLNNVAENDRNVFQREIEAVNLDSSAITRFMRNKTAIINYINSGDPTRNKQIDLLFGPIACVRGVIDQKGFFEKNILMLERKSIGLEMESYGIARACELVNDGETTPIIVKSVMDNTMDKVDEAKTYAAWASAMFVKYILENDLI